MKIPTLKSKSGCLNGLDEEIVRRYDGGKGESAIELALRYGVTRQSITAKLVKAGVIKRLPREQATVRLDLADAARDRTVNARQRWGDELHLKRIAAAGHWFPFYDG